MNIADKARALESRIAKVLSQAAEHAVGSSARDPIAIIHAIVDRVEQHIESGSRGRRLFPFDTVTVSVLTPSREARAHFEAVVAATPTLKERLAARLRSAGCDVADLSVAVTYVSRAARNWDHPQFHVTFERSTRLAPPPEPVEHLPTRIEVTVVRGTAERRTYAAAAARIDLGRGAEVRDNRNRLLRTNHVVFVEGSTGENQTVSRRHAHIVFDADSGDHRLHDDGSVHGTGIVRAGRTIPVPPGARGVRLRSGDEIVLGEARLRLRIGETS